jgi:hypothetical protein
VQFYKGFRSDSATETSVPQGEGTSQASLAGKIHSSSAAQEETQPTIELPTAPLASVDIKSVQPPTASIKADRKRAAAPSTGCGSGTAEPEVEGEEKEKTVMQR